MSDKLPRESLQSTTLIVEKSPALRGDGSFLARDPQDGGVWNLRVTPKFQDRCRQVSEGELKTLAYTVPTVCMAPTIIYQGIREEHEHEWLCYVGSPGTRFTKNGRQVDTQDDDIFLVFVNDERRVFGFAWEFSTGPNTGIPKGAEARFKRRVYP